MATEIKVPTLGESVTEATVARWLKKAGEAVAIDDALVELETDKVTLEVNATAAGVLSEITAPEGSNVAVGGVLGRIDGAAATRPAPPPPAPPPPAPAVAATAPAGDGAAALERAGPAVRKLIAENQLDPARITPTGKDGRLTKADVLGHLQQPAAPPTVSPAPATPPPPTPPAAPAAAVRQPAPRPAEIAPREIGPREERVRMTRLQSASPSA
jgi:2-oxoglutarate dehydrogenase E2 component (dihydrolipoamide succinyltransferase)